MFTLYLSHILLLYSFTNHYKISHLSLKTYLSMFSLYRNLPLSFLRYWIIIWKKKKNINIMHIFIVPTVIVMNNPIDHCNQHFTIMDNVNLSYLSIWFWICCGPTPFCFGCTWTWWPITDGGGGACCWLAMIRRCILGDLISDRSKPPGKYVKGFLSFFMLFTMAAGSSWLGVPGVCGIWPAAALASLVA